MLALFFLLLGGFVLLIAAVRIWMNAPPGSLEKSNSSVAVTSGAPKSRRTV